MSTGFTQIDVDRHNAKVAKLQPAEAAPDRVQISRRPGPEKEKKRLFFFAVK